MLAWAVTQGVVLSAALREEIADGFGDAPTGEDRFDAVVGVLGMLAVLPSPRLTLAWGPETALEGWLFGMETGQPTP